MSCLASYVGKPDEREPLHELPLLMVLHVNSATLFNLSSSLNNC
jgi:hypothetical protein